MEPRRYFGIARPPRRAGSRTLILECSALRTSLPRVKSGRPFINSLIVPITDIAERHFEKSTYQTIIDTCQRKGYEHQVTDLSCNAKLHWIGGHSSSAGKVLMYKVGGGYVNAIQPGHINFLRKYLDKLEKQSGSQWSLALVEYGKQISLSSHYVRDPTDQSAGLAPEAKWPTQLQQASACLSHILSQGHQPADILIGGDSAGGNLTLALLSHLAHPHPAVEPVKLLEPLAGALFISPWVAHEATAKSFKINGPKDFIGAEMLADCSYLLLGGQKRDEYTDPLHADVRWWTAMKDVVRETLIVVGGNEVFLDDDVALARKMEEAGMSVKLKVCGKEIHVACVVDDVLGLEPATMTQTIWQWLQDSF